MDRTIAGLTDLDHNPNIAESLGVTIVLWSLVEINLKGAFMFLTGVGFVAVDGIFANITGFHTRIQVLKSLIDRTNLTKRQKQKFKSKLNKINRLAKTRNKYVHHTWWLDEGSNQTVTMNSKFKPGTKDYLTNVNAGNITIHNNAVRNWCNEMPGFFYSLRDTYLGKSYEPIAELQDHPQPRSRQNKNQKP